MNRRLPFIALLVIGGCSAGADLPAFETRRLATIPEGTDAKWISFSRNGQVAAYISKSKGAERIVMGDRPGKSFALI